LLELQEQGRGLGFKRSSGIIVIIMIVTTTTTIVIIILIILRLGIINVL